MKIYNFFKIFKKISRFFQIFLKFYRIFGEYLYKNLEHLEICICLGFGGGAELPDASEFLEIWVEKSMETCDFWIVLMEFLPFFSNF